MSTEPQMIAWGVWRGAYTMDKVMDLPEDVGLEVLALLQSEPSMLDWNLVMISQSLQRMANRG